MRENPRLPRPPVSERILRGPFQTLVASLGLVLLAGWAPHYWTWPWWPDLDAYATIAQGWSRGIRPYRDVVIFNFPGQIELFWLLGRVVGWGRTAPFYVFDTALLLTLGGLMVLWSRRRLGGVLAGGLGFLGVLSYYLGQDYALVAQRDWQAVVLAATGLLALQAWPSRGWRLASGFLFGLAFAIRPHVILFGPATLLAVRFEDGAGAGLWRQVARRVAEWSGGMVLGIALAFAPLIASGLMGDFVRGVRKASYASSYNQTSWANVASAVGDQLGLRGFPGTASWAERVSRWSFLALLLGLGWLSARGAAGERRRAWVWLAGLAAAILYAPLHPKPHAYLAHPRNLFWCVGLSVVAAAILDRLARRPATRLVAATALLVAAVPGPPAFWDPSASVRALSDLSRAGPPAQAPPGAAGHFEPLDDRSPYSWSDYRLVLQHLRRTTSPTTPLANLLRNVPFPAFNGPLGRVTPLPAESGVIWLWSVEPELETEFARALEESPSGTVAVWDPENPTFDARLKLEHVAEVLRRLYRPEARFGTIEVWRKR